MACLCMAMLRHPSRLAMTCGGPCRSVPKSGIARLGPRRWCRCFAGIGGFPNRSPFAGTAPCAKACQQPGFQDLSLTVDGQSCVSQALQRSDKTSKHRNAVLACRDQGGPVPKLPEPCGPMSNGIFGLLGFGAKLETQSTERGLCVLFGSQSPDVAQAALLFSLIWLS